MKYITFAVCFFASFSLQTTQPCTSFESSKWKKKSSKEQSQFGIKSTRHGILQIWVNSSSSSDRLSLNVNIFVNSSLEAIVHLVQKALFTCKIKQKITEFYLETILWASVKKLSSSRTLNSLFLIGLVRIISLVVLLESFLPLTFV